MTHDELLAKIDEALGEGSYTFTISKLSELLAQGKALRAVVELHKPMKEPKKSGWFEGEEYKEGYVIGCEFDNYHYPCPTIQQIIENLK